VSLANVKRDEETLELVYLGIVPEARGRGFAATALAELGAAAAAAGIRSITLSVDERNKPARRLYDRAGFQEADRRRLFLLLSRP
jgi:ribosomal-protein-alanine N-acetyltransferase